MRIHSSFYLTFFPLSFPDKRIAAPPDLNLKHIFLVAPTLTQACVPSCCSYIHAPSVTAKCACRGHRAELLGFTGDGTVRCSVSRVTSGWSPCPAVAFLATHALSAIRFILLKHWADRMSLLVDMLSASFQSLD